MPRWTRTIPAFLKRLCAYRPPNAVIDTDTGSATDERFFHTTGPAPSGRSSRTAGGSGGSAGSGSAGSAGSGLTGTTGTGQGGSNP